MNKNIEKWVNNINFMKNKKIIYTIILIKYHLKYKCLVLIF